ncbi:MAG TPA: hypothetical protein VJ937_06960 [Salinivirga sp.]|uniref:hypothetical protein n=1 Tax=Salinivirga sp. TaxID=1970192 RepID=UPI002B470C5E|nr:hypothetical protein [Salinivirga sp.]HKK59199.1 hypothetical protein [Salinivirga sp.]
MSDRISKITSILSYILFAISIVFGVLYYYTVVTMEPVPESIQIPLEKTKFTMEQMGSSLDNFVLVVYLLIGLATLSTILFSIVNIFKSAKTAKRSLVSLLVLAAVIFVAFILSSNEIPQFFGAEKFDITPFVSQSVGTGLFSMYLFFALAVLGILYTEIRGAFK